MEVAFRHTSLRALCTFKRLSEINVCFLSELMSGAAQVLAVAKIGP